MHSVNKSVLTMVMVFAPMVGSAAEDCRECVIETVIVTGEKINRSLMDTASSVSVMDAEDIFRRAGLDTVNDILKNVPNLVGTEPGNLAPAVRGTDGTGPAQGADAFFAGTRPRLNYQVDGRTLSYNESIFLASALWDIERVEIFRGPQSTLQGRNAVSGAVVMKTRDPVYETEAGIRVVAGEYDQRQYAAYLSSPLISDQLALRISADYQTRNSPVDFPAYSAVRDPGEYKNLTVRGKLLFEPAAIPQWQTLLTLNHADAHAPQSAGVVRPFEDLDPSFPSQPRFGSLTNGGILDTSWKFNDNFTMQLVASVTDIQVTREAISGTGNVELEATEKVVEPRLQFSLDRVSGFAGMHYFDATQDEFIDLFGGGNFDDQTNTRALFGEATMAVTDRLDLTMGGRYEKEDRERSGGAGPFLISFDESYTEFLPKLSVAWQMRHKETIGAVFSRGYNGGAAGFTFEPPFVSYTYEPEYVNAFEVFYRATLLDDSLQISTNVFYNKYRDMQLPFDLNPDPAVWSFVVRNADEAITYGLELSTSYRPGANVELFAGFGLLDTEVTEFEGSGIENNELPRSPAYTFNTGIFYTHPSGVELSVDARFSDAYHSAVTNEARGKTDPYWLANAQLSYRLDKARIFVDINNLFDSVEPVLLEPGATPADDVATVTQPRTARIGVEYSY